MPAERRKCRPPPPGETAETQPLQCQMDGIFGGLKIGQIEGLGGWWVFGLFTT